MSEKIFKKKTQQSISFVCQNCGKSKTVLKYSSSKRMYCSNHCKYDAGHTNKTKEKQRQAALKQFKDGMPKETVRKIVNTRQNNGSYEINSKLLTKLNHTKKGNHLSDIHRQHISESLQGSKAYNWKGGGDISKGVDFKIWRDKVFARDNWTCQKTKRRGRELHPHHIKNFAQYPELRYDINNGITLSAKMHITFHIKYGFINNTQEQLNQLLRESLLV